MQHRQAVPAEFSEKISLASHQRAADYTVARARLGMFERLFDAAVLVCLTLLGGLQEIDLWVSTLTTHDLLRQILLLVTLSVIISAIGLPFSLYRQFRLEEKFGFNRMTLRLFVMDMIKGTAVGAALGLPPVSYTHLTLPTNREV